MMFGSFRKSSVISVSSEQFASEKSREVLQIVTRKGPPLTSKQVEFCNEDCIVRYLKAKGNHVKRAAKHLRTTLTWRAMLDVDYLTADEFSAELASGIAFVAGQDEDDRPVVIVRLKPDSIVSTQAQKQFLRYFAFTMEVAIACMPNTVQQCVLIFDASNMKRGTSETKKGLRMVIQVMKMVAEHYPERLGKAFMVDAPKMFHLCWKGVGTLLDQKMTETLKFVSSSSTSFHLSASISRFDSISRRILWEDQEDDTSTQYDLHDHNQSFGHGVPISISDIAGASSLLSDENDLSATSNSNRLSIAAAKTTAPPSQQTAKADASLLSDKARARSLSFAAPRACRKEESTQFRSFRADVESAAQKKPSSSSSSSCAKAGAASRKIHQEEGGNSSRRWLQSLSFRFSREEAMANNGRNHGSDGKSKRGRQEDFGAHYDAFLRRAYSEAAYRSYMKPPLAGLISILSSELKLRQTLSGGAAAGGGGGGAVAAAFAMEAMLIDHLQLDRHI